MVTKLKPCPFCGGTASVVKNSNTWYRVVCDDCPCEVGRYWFGKRNDAIEAWNRRAEDK